MQPILKTNWKVLRFTFAAVPIIAGLDKFTNLLTHWVDYLNPVVAAMLPVRPEVFMGIVGVIEIVAGLIVAFRPRLGGYIVAAWLVCIGLSLIASGRYLDVAVRDLVMAVGAYTCASLSAVAAAAGEDRPGRERSVQEPSVRLDEALRQPVRRTA